MRIVNSDRDGEGPEDFQFPGIPPQIFRLIVIGIIVLIVGGFAFQMKPWYTVGQDEKAVVLRLGKLNRIVGPGINLRIPLLEEVIIENVTQRRKIEIGFRTRSNGTVIEMPEEALMVTGDEALVVNWCVFPDAGSDCDDHESRAGG